MKVANIITLTRIALIPVFVALWFYDDWYWAFSVFLLASLTDKLDGYVARRYNQVSNFGKLIDPLADKLLICTAILLLVSSGEMTPIPAILVLAREFVIQSLRVVAMSEGRVLQADVSGKIKMVVQVTAVAAMLCTPVATQSLGFATVGVAAAWIMAAVTIWSGAEYCIKNRDVIGKP